MAGKLLLSSIQRHFDLADGAAIHPVRHRKQAHGSDTLTFAFHTIPAATARLI
jgi:hypothetical protein